IADVVTVLRDGRVVSTCPIARLDTDRLVALMFGGAPQKIAEGSGVSEKEANATDLVVEAEDLCFGAALFRVSVEIRCGEVVCVTGSVGSGRRELARCLAGVEQPSHGSVNIVGRRLRGVRDAVRHGIVFLPEDRKREGLLFELTVLDNIAIGK